MCQSCVDEGNLSQATFDAIEAFLAQWPNAEWGPAHIVLSDDNIEDCHICWCIGLATVALSKNPYDLIEPDIDVELMNKLNWYENHEPDELRATIAFLEYLLTIPEDDR